MSAIMNIVIIGAVIYGAYFYWAKHAGWSWSVPVQTGYRYICPICGKVVKEEISTIRVPRRSQRKYWVQEEPQTCNQCEKKSRIH